MASWLRDGLLCQLAPRVLDSYMHGPRLLPLEYMYVVSGLLNAVSTHSTVSSKTTSRDSSYPSHFQAIFPLPSITATMAVLVPYDVKDITANWSSSAKQFSVTANAPLPLPFVGAEFKRIDKTKDGRKLRLEGFTTGLGGQKAAMMDKAYVENDMAAPPSFQTVSIVLKDPGTKTETTVTVNVTRDAPPVPLRPQPLLVAASKSDTPALSAINIALPAQNFVRITAPMPDITGPRTTIEGRNEGDASFIWRAGQLPGSMYWDVAWAGNGAGVAKGAMFTVTTTVSKTATANGTSSQAANTGTQVTVQPYAISLPVKRDLSDPDV